MKKIHRSKNELSEMKLKNPFTSLVHGIFSAGFEQRIFLSIRVYNKRNRTENSLENHNHKKCYKNYVIFFYSTVNIEAFCSLFDHMKGSGRLAVSPERKIPRETKP